jgi:alpha-1,3/alpha-1,6-mannosyltransferase
MYAGSPVVAVASGGPLETVKDQETGFLRSGDAAGFAEAIARMVREPRLKGTMGRAGHAHVRTRFGLDAFSATLEAAVRQTVVGGKRWTGGWWRLVLVLVLVVVVVLLLLLLLLGLGVGGVVVVVVSVLAKSSV